MVPTNSGNFMLSNRTLEHFFWFLSLCVELVRAHLGIGPRNENDTLSRSSALNSSIVTRAIDTSLTRIN
jgi:hypothetical protein